jgi:hypothetical protein
MGAGGPSFFRILGDQTDAFPVDFKRKHPDIFGTQYALEPIPNSRDEGGVAMRAVRRRPRKARALISGSAKGV